MTVDVASVAITIDYSVVARGTVRGRGLDLLTGMRQSSHCVFILTVVSSDKSIPKNGFHVLLEIPLRVENMADSCSCRSAIACWLSEPCAIVSRCAG